MSTDNQGEAPLYSLLCSEASRHAARFHMPGHKLEPPLRVSGRFDGAMSLDFTELSATGNLFEGTGPIRAAEKLMARAYFADDCMFLTGGATLGVQAACAYFAKSGSRVIADRGCHKSLYNVCSLLDLHPEFIYPKRIGAYNISSGITPAEVADMLDTVPNAAFVIVTSPTYFGVMLDIGGISRVCREHGVPLIVDEAHGAHLPFAGVKNAAASGADISVCSMHKTLPVLGGGALLLTGVGVDMRRVRKCASMFGSSSPSYAVMASMDFARAALLTEAGAEASRFASASAAKIRDAVNKKGVFRALTESEILSERGFGQDPCRVLICAASGGISGVELERRLADLDIFCEMSDKCNITLILTVNDVDKNIERLIRSLDELAEGLTPSEGYTVSPPPVPCRVLSMREAAFSESVTVSIEAAVGRVAAGVVAPYPPGIPVVAPGELIDQKIVAFLREIDYNVQVEVTR